MNKNAGLAIVAVSNYKGENAKEDSNGLMPVYLNPICGNIPDRNVLSGTVARNAGFEEGKAYLAKWTRLEDDAEYGVQYGWTKVNEITDPLAIINAEAQLGAGRVFKVASVVESTVDSQQG